MNLTPLNRAVLLCRPLEGAQKARVKLMGLIHFGPFQFGLHLPVDESPGFVFTELSSGTAVAFGSDEQLALEMLRHRLGNTSVTSFVAQCQLAVDHKKQSLVELRSYRHEVMEESLAS